MRARRWLSSVAACSQLADTTCSSRPPSARRQSLARICITSRRFRGACAKPMPLPSARMPSASTRRWRACSPTRTTRGDGRCGPGAGRQWQGRRDPHIGADRSRSAAAGERGRCGVRFCRSVRGCVHGRAALHRGPPPDCRLRCVQWRACARGETRVVGSLGSDAARRSCRFTAPATDLTTGAHAVASRTKKRAWARFLVHPVGLTATNHCPAAWIRRPATAGDSHPAGR